jgi:hypothetical protein
LTVELRDIKQEEIKWNSPNQLKLHLMSHDKEYETEINFYSDINVEVPLANRSLISSNQNGISQDIVFNST